MFKKTTIALCSFIVLILSGCAAKREMRSAQINSAPTIQQKKYTGEKLISAFPEIKPQWIYTEPEPADGYLFFIGISDKFANEKEARENAHRDCIKKFAAYCGVEVTELYKSITTGFGLSSGISDPTKATVNNEQQAIDALVSRVKTSEWYIEKWASLSDNEIIDQYYKVFVKSKVPEEEYKKVIEQKKQKEIEKSKEKEKQIEYQKQIETERAKALADLPVEMQFAFLTKKSYSAEKILQSGETVMSDESFRLYARPSADCYLYVFNIDSSRKVNLIFPDNANMAVSNPLRKGVEYYIPDRKVYAFDDVKGKEVFYIFAFKEEPKEINELIKQINNNISDAMFKVDIDRKYTAKGTVIRNSNNAIRREINGFPDALTGKPYIMKVYEFMHY
ncbi:MAG TPA: DUF4384 domain-containing protein [bacterium]|nr:DUF4384 domain-containing protein [bacterium]HPN32392.1 DUF4384 domain-containing protein [bacterium]